MTQAYPNPNPMLYYFTLAYTHALPPTHAL